MLSTAMVAHKTNTSPMPADDVIRNFDWDKVNLDATAIRLRDLMRNGVPAAIRYTYSDDVLALYGIDMDVLEGALRHPERVEVRPESFTSDKRYPVLGFHRGDVSVILGLRQPITPKVIAAYATSRLEHDSHRVGDTGGGGSTDSTKGLPGTRAPGREPPDSNATTQRPDAAGLAHGAVDRTEEG